ncbi:MULTISPECIES: hypothetical protein [unclassified Pseudomonas]|uniref:hypothetical protein n=1 Tax=unclassified Pseudomonas TaxID=196821 RepID=UPI0021BAFCC0|nr:MULTISPECIES: hypothetical protein [unclassified Pseudomonas]MCT8163470.1 hypothetical protein [Pseudomonas sp. HD6422]MCT8182534.1 hypothetical protein [Pseudomonas sp. HD6421]
MLFTFFVGAELGASSAPVSGSGGMVLGGRSERIGLFGHHRGATVFLGGSGAVQSDENKKRWADPCQVKHDKMLQY